MGGTGQKLADVATIVGGVASIVATLLSMVYVYLLIHIVSRLQLLLPEHYTDEARVTGRYGSKRELFSSSPCATSFLVVRVQPLINNSKNYRKPLLQRYVVRILLM